MTDLDIWKQVIEDKYPACSNELAQQLLALAAASWVLGRDGTHDVWAEERFNQYRTLKVLLKETSGKYDF